MAVITRIQVETVLIRRVGAWMTFVGLDGVTHAGANGDLSDPIASALLQLGYSVADITNVSDADLSPVTVADQPKLLALAELRTLETIAQAWTGGGKVAGLGFQVDDSAFGAQLEKAIARLQKTLLTQYGIGIVSAAPYVGGISIADKQTQEQDTDRVQPAFTRDLHKSPADRLPNDPYWRDYP